MVLMFVSSSEKWTFVAVIRRESDLHTSSQGRMLTSRADARLHRDFVDTNHCDTWSNARHCNLPTETSRCDTRTKPDYVHVKIITAFMVFGRIVSHDYYTCKTHLSFLE